MKRVKVINWKGKEIEGLWNEKFYTPQVEGNSDGIHRIYIDNERVHITEEEKEKLISSISNNKVQEDNSRIKIIRTEYEKLDNEAKVELLKFLIDDLDNTDNAKELETTLKSRIAILNRI